MPTDPWISWLLSYLYFLSGDLSKAGALASSVTESMRDQCPFWYVQFLVLVGCTQDRRSKADLDAMRRLIEEATLNRCGSRFAEIGLVFAELFFGNQQSADYRIQQFSGSDCLEFQRLKVDWLIAREHRDEAIALLRNLLRRCPESRGLLLHGWEACSRLQMGAVYLPWASCHSSG